MYYMKNTKILYFPNSKWNSILLNIVAEVALFISNQRSHRQTLEGEEQRIAGLSLKPIQYLNKKEKIQLNFKYLWKKTF